ncbi:hypothetical protein B0J14DRAFT_580363 [Halenospora varia]|nr:hypothetical protein B0J14DRAFT_580363 [Halenospora varia]
MPLSQLYIKRAGSCSGFPMKRLSTSRKRSLLDDVLRYLLRLLAKALPEHLDETIEETLADIAISFLAAALFFLACLFTTLAFPFLHAVKKSSQKPLGTFTGALPMVVSFLLALGLMILTVLLSLRAGASWNAVRK